MTECENLRIGNEFLVSRKWPVALRNTNHDWCYCDQCYLPSSQDTYSVAGYNYVIPRDWIRFGVYVDEPFATHHDVWKTWANCYHGTSIENAKSIIEHRQLLLPRDITLNGKQLQIREGHIPEEYYFFTTPTIKYAALNSYTHTYSFISPTNRKRYRIKVALQCKQKPDSFTVQAETVGARKRQETICTHVSNDQIEWKTQQRSAIMPYGLMLHIQNGDNNDTTCDPTKKSDKINCPHCSQPNVFKDGVHKEGAVVTCVHESCKKNFQQLCCPHCSRSIIWKNANYNEGKVIVCPHESCKKTFQQLCCPHCTGSIQWKKANYKQGKFATCPHESCKKTFQQLCCPHCSKSLVWKNGNYIEGRVTNCPHESCKKKFQQLCCPHCSGSITWKNADYHLGKVTTCPHENCKKTFQQLCCPHCSGSITWKNANYHQGKVTTCPYESCKKTFQQLSCPHCSGSNTWTNANYKEELVTTCVYESCKKKFQQVCCRYCSASIIWKDANHKPGSVITCPHNSCKKTFRKE